MKITIIEGNLGDNARSCQSGGRDFIAFNVADSERFTGSDGQVKERTEWISCTMPGKQENLLPYLVKGAKVLCVGRAQTRLYSSPKDRCMKAGLNLHVDRLELIGKRPDEVPGQVATADGQLHNTFKAYYIDANDAAQAPTPFVYSTDGKTMYDLDQKTGFIYPKPVVLNGTDATAHNEESNGAQLSNDPKDDILEIV